MEAAGLVIAVTGLTVKLIKLSTDIEGMKNAPDYVRDLKDELNELRNTLDSVKLACSTMNPLVCMSLDQKIKSFQQDLERLSARFNSAGKSAVFKKMLGRVRWPLDEQASRESIDRIERFKTHLVIQLQAHQT